jgi:hypothetical protein
MAYWTTADFRDSAANAVLELQGELNDLDAKRTALHQKLLEAERRLQRLNEECKIEYEKKREFEKHLEEKAKAKKEEQPKAERSCALARDIVDPDWYNPQLKLRGAENKPSYGDPVLEFNVVFDHDTRVHNLEGRHHYAVKCKTVLGNDVVIVIKGNLIW